ncbi:hypothetical protein BC938DRAFT_471370 [Jimgerdemannia flammicorona]|uniref:Uncharacterized protein n=1 Tax=Jimgerdemannia flammicorona TaxID=994334 RepID=A0A433Q858_9FUNG|nr:hypothetical protein BC938DRAFT_471370 [Jimgerdemannia flammicorona]
MATKQIIVYACLCLNIKIHLARKYPPDTHDDDRRVSHLEEHLKGENNEASNNILRGYRLELGMGGIAVVSFSHG